MLLSEPKFHSVRQGREEWHALRQGHYCASDAAAMMGVSPYETRASLVRRLATKQAVEIDDYKRQLFGRGHELERERRKGMEATLKTELFPVTVTRYVDDLPLLASMDGITIDHKTGWEHKMVGRDTYESIMVSAKAPEYHEWQIQQQLLVSGAESILYQASTQDGDYVLVEYAADPLMQERLIRGWRQLDEDVRNYRHLEVVEGTKGKPTISGALIIPDLTAIVLGESNRRLDKWRAYALEAIAELNMEPKTEEEIAEAEANVKWLAEAESKLKDAKAEAMKAETDITRAFAMVDEVLERFRAARLALEKPVKARKEAIRDEIVDQALARLKEQFPLVPPDARDRIAAATKNKKTRQSLIDAADGERAAIAVALSEASARRWPIQHVRDKLVGLVYNAVHNNKPQDGGEVNALELCSVCDRLIEEVREMQKRVLSGGEP